MEKEPLSTVASLILALTSLAIGSMFIYSPAVLQMKYDFAVSDFVMKLTLLSGPFLSLITSIPIGYLADAKGRLPLLKGAQILFLAGSILCCIAPNIYIFFLGRFFFSISTSIFTLTASVVLADLFQGVTLARYLGLYTALFPAMLTLSPILGGLLLEDLGWRAIFGFLFITMGTLMCFTWNRVPETHSPCEDSTITPPALGKKIVLFLKKPQVAKLILINGLSITIGGIFTINAPFILMEIYGFSPQWFSVIAAIPVIFQFFGALIYRHFVTHYGAFKGLKAGLGPCLLLVLASCLYLAHFVADNPYLLVGVVSFYSMGAAFIITSTVTLILEEYPSHKGLSNSVLSLARNLSLVLVVPISSFYAEESTDPVVGGMAVVGAVIAFLIYHTFPLSQAPKETKSLNAN